MTDRGSGRTTRQLAALPDGAFYLVPGMGVVRHCQQLLRSAGRQPRAINFVTRDMQGTIWGARVPAWDVDHAYFEVVGSRSGITVYDLLWMAAGQGPLSEQ
ncbi:hypothetical protein [Sphingomonas abietis]|uniref:Uncharacterized protein n=1 Tax=Sphingomonas abietis TaxID=3012344 RepID=A0ABY7NRZ0_9SPHN|nr:hypothetical protein [Sphingomonas abietis]WBO23942.1 hypothetical protein PBT88_07485 [Sphingomonas abietis]